MLSLHPAWNNNARQSAKTSKCVFFNLSINGQSECRKTTVIQIRTATGVAAVGTGDFNTESIRPSYTLHGSANDYAPRTSTLAIRAIRCILLEKSIAFSGRESI